MNPYEMAKLTEFLEKLATKIERLGERLDEVEKLLDQHTNYYVKTHRITT